MPDSAANRFLGQVIEEVEASGGLSSELSNIRPFFRPDQANAERPRDLLDSGRLDSHPYAK